MAKERNPLSLVLGAHTMSYVHMKTPSVFKDQAPKYSVTVLIKKNHPDVARIKAHKTVIYNEVGKAKFGGTPITSPKLFDPLRDGDELFAEDPEKYAAYEGCYYLKATNGNQPRAFDEDGQEIIDLDEKIYSGAVMRCEITGWAYNNESKGFGYWLESVKFVEHGEKLGGRTEATADAYDDDDADYSQPSAPAGAKPAAPKPAAPKAPDRIWNEDADGTAIWSEDGGETWYY